MTFHELSGRVVAEAEGHLIALLDPSDIAHSRDHIEAFASSVAVAEAPETMARILLEPMRTGRCEHLPARFWFVVADIFHRTDRHADCRAALSRAFERATNEDLDDCARGYFLLGHLDASQHDWRRAVASWEACLRLLPPEQEIEQRVLGLLGAGWEALGCPDRASGCFVEALKLAAGRGRVAEECEALFQLGRHAWDRGWTDQALVYFNQARQRAHEEGYPEGEAAAEIGVSALYREVGELGPARDSIERGLAKARDGGDRLLQATALEHRAEIQLRTGDVESARSSLEEAIFLANGANAHALLAALYHMLAMLHERSGRKTLALGTYEKALRERRRAGDAAGLGATLNNVAALHVELGDPAAARRCYREALVAFAESGHDRKETSIVIENITKLDIGAGESREETSGADAEGPGDTDAGAGADGSTPAPERSTRTDDVPEPRPVGRRLPPPIPFPGLRGHSKE